MGGTWKAYAFEVKPEDQLRFFAKHIRPVLEDWKAHGKIVRLNFNFYSGADSSPHITVRLLFRGETDRFEFERALTGRSIVVPEPEDYGDDEPVASAYEAGSRLALTFIDLATKDEAFRKEAIHGFLNSIGLSYQEESSILPQMIQLLDTVRTRMD